MCEGNQKIFLMNSTITIKGDQEESKKYFNIFNENLEIKLESFEFYPTVVELQSEIYLCFVDDFYEFLRTWNGVRYEAPVKIYWVVNNTNHRSTLYNNSIFMDFYDNLHGIIVIEDREKELFNIPFRGSDKLVLRVSPKEAHKLK